MTSRADDAVTLEQLDQQIAAKKAAIAQVAASPPTSRAPVDEGWWSTQNAMTMSAAVLSFGVFVVLIVAYLMKIGKTDESVLRILGTILVIISALFLVVAGYDNSQIAPVMGFFGTVVGYLLGKESGSRANASTEGERTGGDRGARPR